ncbi:adenylate/guanylate cyclase domain-containing protein [Liquorilactobacillus mali]|uniref:Mononucleotidyl cyclase n=1 Tax=Liquorilactobacillus oeni DSM 19972 TaxID=1423777 RepID=A0A0R1MJL2_9LACO|nr:MULTISPECIES: adenylate/guanylate cyclase domain-containing protein [Liquorilactobacillus]KRL06148.1 mononucleotidyl cyclase [Liquorilactobacillus oeni DSM 19972]MDN7146381.1 adenylate/guanylate cyclase domain-containing protein [Liquorilactobacillus mali]
MSDNVVKITQKDFNLDKAITHIKEVLFESNTFDTVDNWSDLNNLTFKNGRYIENTALFVDIRKSSKFVSSTDSRIVARLYRSYISEVIMILRSHSCCKEINIVGDCISAIFTENKKQSQDNYNNDRSDVIEALLSASMIQPTIEIINTLFSKKYDSYENIKIGIGIASGKALIVKAGESGSGINKPIFLGENINLAAHLCDKANTSHFSKVLVNEFVKEHSKKYETSSSNEPFSNWLNKESEKIDDQFCYGGAFYRVAIHDRLEELSDE